MSKINIKIKSVVINEYKGVKDLDIKLSPKLTCLIGNNATGKTSILEGASCQFCDVEDNDFPSDNEYIFTLDQNDFEFLNGYDSFKLEMKIKYSKKTMKIKDYKLIGHERFMDSYFESLNVKSNEYLDKLEEIHIVLKEISEELDSLPNELLETNINGIKVIQFNKKLVKKELAKYEGYIKNKAKPFLVEENSVKYKRFDHSVDLDVFNVEFLDEKDYLEFYDSVKYLNVKIDGYEYKLDEMNSFYYGLHDKFIYLKKFLHKSQKDYLKNIGNVYDKDGDIFDHIENLNNEISKIAIQCDKYLKNSKIISSSHILVRNNETIGNNTINNHILGIMNVDTNKEEFKNLSSGIKWLSYLSKKISESKSKLIFIDEPGMYLNHVLQRKLLEVFEYLIDEGYQIIYTTHIPLLVALRHDSIVYNTSFNDSVKVTIKDLSKLEEESKLIVGDLLIMSVKKMILVEGPTDECLMRHHLTKYLNKDLSRYNLMECTGQGITQMIGLCVKMGLDFIAIADYDKIDDIKSTLGNDYTAYEYLIEYVGNEEVKEIEAYFTEDDFKNLCIYKKDEHKMNLGKMEDHFEKEGEISEELKERLNEVIGNFQLD